MCSRVAGEAEALWGSAELYGNIRPGRLQVVLAAVQQYLRDQSPMYGAVSLPTALEIEHITSQGWCIRWILSRSCRLTLLRRVTSRVSTIGNLTLGHKVTATRLRRVRSAVKSRIGRTPA